MATKHPHNVALTPPQFYVLSDNPAVAGDIQSENFNLNYSLGPVYDIIRHPSTQTPLAIAIYGKWGEGKTTAMKWLDHLISQWNANGRADDKQSIKTIWFYPWKYHSQEDVWQGLIAEVILNAIDVKNASVATVTKAAKQFGLFLGRSFLHVLDNLKLSAKAKSDAAEAGAELSLGAVRQIISEYHQSNHPEKPYLNDFEVTLQAWLKDTLGKNERMAIFIDDLDRCMPEIALQVLESLKLYLNISNLIFVLGVDRDVIEPLVAGHYKKLGLGDDKSKNYLAKMFAVEVNITPSERRIENFCDVMLAKIAYWQDKLSDDERKIFRPIIAKIAGRNPREIKRLINSSMMAGAGAEMIAAAKNIKLSFAQGLQLFFIRKILADRYTQATMLGSKLGDEFFRQWSNIVRENKDEQKFSRTVKVPSDYLDQWKKSRDIKEGTLDEVYKQLQNKYSLDAPSFAPPAYHYLIKDSRFAGFLHLLADDDLGDLMQIEFSDQAETITASLSPSKNADIIKEAIARSLNKKPEDLTANDDLRVKILDFDNAPISDLAHLKNLTNLDTLSLARTPVSNLTPLNNLTSLTELWLARTPICDLTPLNNLTNLEYLSLFETPISNLTPLKNLTNLTYLWLNGTQVSDLTPLHNLKKLKELHLRNTRVSNDQINILKKALPNLKIKMT